MLITQIVERFNIWNMELSSIDDKHLIVLMSIVGMKVLEFDTVIKRDKMFEELKKRFYEKEKQKE